MQRRRAVKQEKAQMPIFFDPSGHRARRILLTAGGVMVVIALLMTWIISGQLAPLWHSPFNQAAEYPQQLVSQNGTMPTLGDGIFSRVDLVKRAQGMTYLADPFTGKVLRRATPAEVKKIGPHTAVVEHYTYVPDYQIALTFDDGPSSAYTPQILNVLERNHVPATFFVIGENVLNNPGLVAREVRDGDVVGLHTLTHVQFDRHESVRDREELIGNDRIVRDAAGYVTRLWRMPYSADSPLGLLTAQQLGYLEVDADLDTQDWRYSNTQIPVPKLDGNGHIVIMHDGGPHRQETVLLLERLIKEAKAKHYQFITVPNLLPKSYTPTTVVAGIQDHLAAISLWLCLDFGAQGLREVLVGFLLFGLFLTVVVTTIYVALSFFKHRRARKRIWPADQQLPPVSAVIPARNEEKVLRSALESILRSTHPSYEVIVVVNDSTDGTMSVAQEVAAGCPRVRVIQSAAGKATALNTGIAAARNEIVALMDADTKLLPQTLSKLARHFIDERVGGVAGHVKVGNVRGFLTRCQAVEYLSGIAVVRLGAGVIVAPGACSAFRKSALVNAGGVLPDTMTEDFELTLRMRRQQRVPGSRWRVVQDNEAIALTEAPESLGDLLRQRFRWAYGGLQTNWKNRDMFFRPRYGWVGMYLLPYNLLTTLAPPIFMPIVYAGGIASLVAGNWHSAAFFTAVAAIANIIPTVAAIRMVREHSMHLLVVPVAAFVLDWLRIIVLYVTLLRIAKGRSMSWYSPKRKDSVTVSLA